MSTLKLQTFQADFAAALIASDPAARPKGFSSKAAVRFRIYRNNFYHGLSQQLAEAYPVVRRLVGDGFFFATEPFGSGGRVARDQRRQRRL